MLNKLKSLFKKPEQPQPIVIEKVPEVQVEKEVEPDIKPVQPKKPRKPRKPKQVETTKTLSAKELATQNNEPYINIIKVELDHNNINNGSFELDWNDKFVLNLIRAGYKLRDDESDQTIVDRWFQSVCRNIALELYEQQVADPEKRDDIRIIRSKDIGNGRSEVS
jgi:hypothetical protein